MSLTTKKLILFFALLFSGCAALKQNPFPKDWQQTPTPPELSSSNENNGNLKITLLDIGQGDSTLITTPNGKNILIDAGNIGKGTDIILPYLQSHRINSLDMIIATHYDADHIGGISEVIAGADGQLETADDLMPFQGVYDRGGTPLDSSPLYIEYLKAAEKNRFSVLLGDPIGLDPEVSIRCVAVNGAILNGPTLDLFQVGVHETENSAAISLLIEYKNFRYLTSADLTGGGSPGGFKTLDVETALAEQIGEITAVHVNHHGSSSSSNQSFVNSLKPKVALISVGNGNSYHHPDQQVLERWQKSGAKIWLTEKGAGGFITKEKVANGAVEMITDGNSVMINGEKIQ